jgi:hypothetical protein
MADGRFETYTFLLDKILCAPDPAMPTANVAFFLSPHENPPGVIATLTI